jgi:hypothetical protein
MIQDSGQISLNTVVNYWNTAQPGIGAQRDLNWFSGRQYYYGNGLIIANFPTSSLHLHMFYHTSSNPELGGGGGGK